MSEQELKALKEQIKQELIEEMKKPRQENLWKKIKQEYKEEFNKFNYIEHWEAMNCEGRLVTRDKEVIAEYPLTNAIGTLLRITYKAENVSKINADYEEVKKTVGSILNILKEKRVIS